MKGPVKTIRIDLPSAALEHKGSSTFFFLDSADGQRWHPWWNQLFVFLLELERQPVGLTEEGREMEVSLLTGQKRQEFLALLQTAPESEINGHRTLRTALRQLPQHQLDVPVRYFGQGPEEQ